jgi:prepilin-type N-terminal cleavage/methylation domain-containing protein
MTSNRGFSLIEVIAAMVILTVGVMGLAASSTAITKMTEQGGRSGGSAIAAASLFDSLRATSCASLGASGSATAGKFSHRWTVTTTGLMRTVVDTVTYAGTPFTRRSAYATWLSCAPEAQ